MWLCPIDVDARVDVDDLDVGELIADGKVPFTICHVNAVNNGESKVPEDPSNLCPKCAPHNSSL